MPLETCFYFQILHLPLLRSMTSWPRLNPALAPIVRTAPQQHQRPRQPTEEEVVVGALEEEWELVDLTRLHLHPPQSFSSGWNREGNWRLQRPSQKKQSISGKGYEIWHINFLLTNLLILRLKVDKSNIYKENEKNIYFFTFTFSTQMSNLSLLYTSLPQTAVSKQSDFSLCQLSRILLNPIKIHEEISMG